MKPIINILTEAVVVGVLFMMIFEIVKRLLKGAVSIMMLTFIVGIVFYILLEVTGLHQWFAQTYLM